MSARSKARRRWRRRGFGPPLLVSGSFGCAPSVTFLARGRGAVSTLLLPSAACFLVRNVADPTTPEDRR